jgi:hypothetical protein
MSRTLETGLFDGEIVYEIALNWDWPLGQTRNTIRPRRANLLDTKATFDQTDNVVFDE